MALACLPGCRTFLAAIQPPTHVVVTAQFQLPVRVGGLPELQWIKVNEVCVHPETPYLEPHFVMPALDGFDIAWAHAAPRYAPPSPRMLK